MKKILSFFIVITLIIMLLISQVYAHNVEIESSNYIEFSVEGNKLYVIINGSVAALNYTQFIELSDDNYENIQKNLDKDWSSFVPNYNDNNWREGLMLPTFDSTKHYILWVKIETTNGDKYYDYTICSPEQTIVIQINDIPSNSTFVNRESLKNNIGDLLAYPLTIESSSTAGSGKMTIDNEGVKVTRDDTKIRFSSIEFDYSIDMYYTISEDKVIWNVTIDNLDDTEPTTDAEKKEKFTKLMMNSYIESYYIPVTYLAVADCMNIDKSLAYTYYAQQILEQQTTQLLNDEESSKKDATYTSEIITQTRKIQNNKTNYSLEINTAKLSKLNQSKINSSSNYIVKLETGTETHEPTTFVSETKKDNNEKQDTGSSVINGNSKTNNDNSEQKDFTVANSTLPKAGNSMNILCIIGVIILSGLIGFIKIYKYKDIK